MRVIPLGAGQDVGKSCIVVTIKDKTIMFDCGIHLGYNDSRKLPNFDYFNESHCGRHFVDIIVISHFHIDHCGSLPYFVETTQFDGLIFMTHPTRAALPIVLEDCKKIFESKSQMENQLYNTEQINNCLSKVVALNMEETYEIEQEFIIRPYYAGHVIGAAMFFVRYLDETVVYTGDFSTIPDRYLRGATIDCLRPDLLITESTYGNVVRDSRKSKEREMILAIHKTIEANGKVLIPSFALGRAQEICLLLKNYCERVGLTVPIYFTTGLIDKINDIYLKFASYTNESLDQPLKIQSILNSKFVQPFEKEYLDFPGPMIIFATPAMLINGPSLSIFKSICHDPKNTIILPGYCSKGTIGEKIINGLKRIEIGKNIYDINMKVYNISLSGHADMSGILKIIGQCKPENVMLVHGDKGKMNILKEKIKAEFEIPVYYPPNDTLIEIPTNKKIPILVNKNLIQKFVDLEVETQNINLCFDIEKDSEEKVIVKSIQQIDRPNDKVQ